MVLQVNLVELMGTRFMDQKLRWEICNEIVLCLAEGSANDEFIVWFRLNFAKGTCTMRDTSAGI